jgi:transcription initiation factor TFIID subunit 8
LLSNSNRNRNESTETTTRTRTRSDPDEDAADVDVAPVVLPTKLPIIDGDRVSVLEAFAPAIEMLGGGGVLCDDDDDDEIEGGKTVIPASTSRPTVHFKFRTGKKFIGESFDDRNKKKSALHAISLVGREDERDDKKRRAEYILRQSMENPQELTLL